MVPTQTGDFRGKCAELCGAYHSDMLFNVKVVDQATYEQHIADLKAKGNTGQLDNSRDPEKIMNQDQSSVPSAGGQ